MKGSLAAIAAGALYAIAAQLAFNAGTVLPVAVPLATLAIALAASVAIRAATEITARNRVSRYNDELEAAVLERTKELAETQLEVVVRLAHAAELHDDDTGEHIDRMSHLCAEVALELGLPLARAEMIRHAAVLHDVGKIGVPGRDPAQARTAHAGGDGDDAPARRRRRAPAQGLRRGAAPGGGDHRLHPP